MIIEFYYCSELIQLQETVNVPLLSIVNVLPGLIEKGPLMATSFACI
jgi:hypothetical protein